MPGECLLQSIGLSTIDLSVVVVVVVHDENTRAVQTTIFYRKRFLCQMQNC